jgi:hypothetical protein
LAGRILEEILHEHVSVESSKKEWAGMAHTVICLGVLSLGLAIAVPASAQHQNGGYIAVSKMQIDPHMTMLNDGPDPKQQKAQPHAGAPMASESGIPLDQLQGQDPEAPAGDDPISDNADDSDAVYTA